MLAAGRYKGKATDVKIDKTETDKLRALVQVEVTDGEAKGQTIVWHGYFTEAARDMAVQCLKVMGWDGANIRQLKSGLAGGLGGNEFYLVVEHDTFVDKSTNESRKVAKVKWINPLNGGGIQSKIEASDAELDALAVSMGQSAVKTVSGPVVPF